MSSGLYSPTITADRALVNSDGPGPGVANAYDLNGGVSYTFDLGSGELHVKLPASPDPNTFVELKQRPGTSITAGASLSLWRNGHDFEIPELDDTDVLWSDDANPAVILNEDIGTRNKSYRWVFVKDGVDGFWLIDKNYFPAEPRVGSAGCPEDTAFSDITSTTFTHLNIFTSAPYSARGIIIDTTGSTFSFERAGYYYFSISGAMEHDELNAGRAFWIRLYNATDLAAGERLFIPTGRNSPGTLITSGIVASILPADLGDLFRIEIALDVGSASYTSVNFPSLGYDLFAIH